MPAIGTTTLPSPLARARAERGLSLQDVADWWSEAWPDDAKTRKTVQAWESGKRAASVQVLRRLAALYDCTVGELLGEESPVPLTAALAVVTWGRRVLLVENRDSGRWQFPAGKVKPGRDPENIATRECLAETGVQSQARSFLGKRVHPVTRVVCHYYACDYLTGDVLNGDPDENTTVLWVPIATLAAFLNLDEVYRPVLDHLGVSTACPTPLRRTA